MEQVRWGSFSRAQLFCMRKYETGPPSPFALTIIALVYHLHQSGRIEDNCECKSTKTRVSRFPTLFWRYGSLPSIGDCLLLIIIVVPFLNFEFSARLPSVLHDIRGNSSPFFPCNTVLHTKKVHEKKNIAKA